MRGAPAAGWAVSEVVGAAASLHEGAAALVTGAEPARRLLRRAVATDRCVVLGSTQPDEVVDAWAASAAGVAVTRRRSGGAAVMVGPGEAEWLDVVVPVGDPLWDPDIGKAAWWVGDAWVTALGEAGLPGASAWRGPVVRDGWSALVCFAGLGAGEVTIGGRKVVGVSQRRTRSGVLLQCAVPIRWDPGALLALMALPPALRRSGTDELSGRAAGLGDATGRVVEAFVRTVAGGAATGG